MLPPRCSPCSESAQPLETFEHGKFNNVLHSLATADVVYPTRTRSSLSFNPVRECTSSNRDDEKDVCQWSAFSPFLPFSEQSIDGELWFANAADQCAANGVKLFYTPAGNTGVTALMTQAATYMEDRTAAVTNATIAQLNFTALGVNSVADIPAADVEFPLDGCTFFIDFSATCADVASIECTPWHFVVRPPYVPGG